MFCPKCSQAIANETTQFCSKCGFRLGKVKHLLENDGESQEANELSKQQKGIRQGSKLIILSLILFPAFVLLSSMFPPNDRLVESSPSNTWFEQIGWTILWTLFLAGAARIAFALVFERKSFVSEDFAEKTKQIKVSESKNALPPMRDAPISDFGKWKTTDELFEPIFAKQKTSGDLK
ncbi:MAG: zinc ribbon domain-containing protein [Acidobacteriota bacterium]|nr:zinc ribbon domain-containing protein [Acidobacteriota bacterium]